MRPVRVMKRSVLRSESIRIQSQIRMLLIQSYSYDNGLIKQLNIITAISRLQEKLSALHREMQQKKSADAWFNYKHSLTFIFRVLKRAARTGRHTCFHFILKILKK